MTGHLPPVAQPTRPRRLESRAEIDAWVAERGEVLTRLVEMARRGEPLPWETEGSEVRTVSDGQVPLDVGEAA
jgi:hypothetical protein